MFHKIKIYCFFTKWFKGSVETCTASQEFIEDLDGSDLDEQEKVTVTEGSSSKMALKESNISGVCEFYLFAV